jgi:hypothetical protein
MIDCNRPGGRSGRHTASAYVVRWCGSGGDAEQTVLQSKELGIRFEKSWRERWSLFVALSLAVGVRSLALLFQLFYPI